VSKPQGIRIRRTDGVGNYCYLVPVLQKPYATGPIDCPTCLTFHPVKTVHLWLEPDGSVIVSPGVLEQLRMAGMPELEVVNMVDNPPPLRIGVGKQNSVQERRDWRAAQDNKNRAANLWWSKLTKKGAPSG
jgi:hypothetical protein